MDCHRPTVRPAIRTASDGGEVVRKQRQRAVEVCVSLQEPSTGPDAMFSTALPPSRGQYQTIATLGLQLLSVDPPKNRLEATIAIARLSTALMDPEVAAAIKPAKDLW